MVIKRRSDVEIIKDIISVSQDGVKKTKILYKVNLSFVQLQSYLSYLIDQNILEEKLIETDGFKNDRIYKSTPKGDKLLSNINKTLSYFE